METIKRRKQYIRERFLLIGVVFAVVLAAVILFMNGHRNTGKELTFSYSNMQKTEGSELFEILAESSTEAAEVPVVAAQEASPYDGRFIANITDTLNVRAAASTDADVVGKMYPGCVGDIVGTEGEWTQITSGNVNGYVFSSSAFAVNTSRVSPA